VLYGALSKPEPCAGKLACTVLRGLSDGDITQLPDLFSDNTLCSFVE
jgi:hypothetical protein